MYSEEDLLSAVRSGVLTEDSAQAFRSHVARAKGGSVVGEEYFRLITGFNDIFVVIACSLLLAAVYWIGGSVVKILGSLGLAIASWLLAEFFTRKRRMALPSIVLLLTLIYGVGYTSHIVSHWIFGPNNAVNLLPIGAAVALVSWLHWARFKVPVTVAVGVMGLVSSSISLLALIPSVTEWVFLLLCLAGFVVFGLAIQCDASDISRTTRRSDVAFWLHLLAAPLIVHPIFSTLGVFEGVMNSGVAASVLVLYLLMTLASLAIDRRALMVSALVYVLVAFTNLLGQYGVGQLNLAVTALVIGAALLLLSAFWQSARKLVVTRFPAVIRKRLPLVQ